MDRNSSNCGPFLPDISKCLDLGSWSSSSLKSLLTRSILPDPDDVAPQGQQGNDMNPEEVRYQNLLQELRLQRDTESITNRYPWQSRLAFEQLLLMAIELRKQFGDQVGDRGVVRILSGSFPWRVYGPSIGKTFTEFLQLGGEVQVLIWSDILTDNRKLLSTYEALANGCGKFQYRLSGTSENGDKLSHMFLVGSSAYRLEAPHKVFGGNEVSEIAPTVPARICFNDPEGGSQLVEYFKTLWNICQQNA